MSIVPLISFKAGMCDLDTRESPHKAKPDHARGYIYLYLDDDLIRFCWRIRNAPLDQPSLDLHMVPTDGSFVPYKPEFTERPGAVTNGRIFVLKFMSTSQRYLFWLQSKPQNLNDFSQFSPRDLEIGEIVDRLLHGQKVKDSHEFSQVGLSGPDGDGDQGLNDPDNHEFPGGASGAGADATGDDIRHGFASSREGSADGAKAAAITTSSPGADVVESFLDSLQGNLTVLRALRQPSRAAQRIFPFLTHLLPATTTVDMIEKAPVLYIDTLLDHLPSALLFLSTKPGHARDESIEEIEDNTFHEDGDSLTRMATPERIDLIKASMSVNEKRSLLRMVMHSPHFHLCLSSMTVALRSGLLPHIAMALNLHLETDGRPEGVEPIQGDAAVKVFVDAMKRDVKIKSSYRSSA